MILTACPLLLAAQTSSPLGRFDVDYARGCAPLTIRVTDLSGSGVSVYEYQGTGSGTTNQPTYTYNVPGQYYLVQTIQNFNPRQDSLLIKVFPPDPPEFELLTCESLGASIQIIDNQYEKYEIDYGDGTIITVNANQSVPDHFYAVQGTYSITVLGQYNNAANNCGSNTQSFNTINSILPANLNQLEVLNNGNILLNYTLNQDIIYDIQIAVENGSTFQKLKTISNQSSVDTVRNLSQNRNYCFRIISYDPCAGNTITSNSICTSRLTTQANDGVNNLSWTTVAGQPTGFQILRNQSSISMPAAGKTSYSDSDIECNIKYCYLLETFFPGGGTALTPAQCVTSYSTKPPPAIDNISVSVSNPGLRIDWYPSVINSSSSYIMRGSKDQKTYLNIDTLITTSAAIQDTTYTCFRIFEMDGCGNLSKTGVSACRIVLTGFQSGNTFTMSWNDYLGWVSGVDHYEVQIFDDQSGLLQTIDNGTLTSLTQVLDNFDNQVLIFIVKAVPVDATIAEVLSNTITLIREPVINIPRAFTPNQDGLNDFFQVTGKFIGSQQLVVFDRWGQIIYAADENSNGWDGKIGGKMAPAGPYVYDVEVIDSQGRKFRRKGSFVLLR